MRKFSLVYNEERSCRQQTDQCIPCLMPTLDASHEVVCSATGFLLCIRDELYGAFLMLPAFQ
jgi:hypothetical protein